MGRGGRSKKKKTPGVVRLPGGVMRIRPIGKSLDRASPSEATTTGAQPATSAAKPPGQPSQRPSESKLSAPQAAPTAPKSGPPPGPAHRPTVGAEPRHTTSNTAPRVLDLVIGLDFGTAFTKCVVRAPTQAGEPTFAIPLGGRLHEEGLLARSQVHQSEDGEYSLEPRDQAQLHSDLKAPLIFGATVGNHVRENHIVAFLALVLRRARSWIIDQERALLKDRAVRWSLNLGLPAASHNDNFLERTFRNLGRLAWLVSTQEGPVSTAMIRAVRASRQEPNASVDVIPEVAAAVTGYARSRQRRDGLHLLVDVGAGTFDACTFVLHDWGGDRISILQAEVEPIGVLRHTLDPRQVEREARRTVSMLLDTTRSRRDPNSPHWNGELRYFMAGGGRTIPEYRNSIPSGGPPFFREVGAIEARSLKPTVSDATFRRLIVAWGLSYDSLNIGRIDKPHTIEDAERTAPVQHRVTLAPPAFRSGPRYDED